MVMMQDCLSKLPCKPVLVTVARSAEDEYTPATAADEVLLIHTGLSLVCRLKNLS